MLTNPHVISGIAILAVLAIGVVSLIVLAKLKWLSEGTFMLWGVVMFFIVIATQNIVQGISEVVR